MGEIEQQSSPEEKSVPIDRQIRDLAAQLGIAETPEIMEILKPADERAVQATEKDLAVELDKVRENHPEATFTAWANLIMAAYRSQGLYNDLSESIYVLNNENTHPDISAQIEALMAQL